MGFEIEVKIRPLLDIEIADLKKKVNIGSETVKKDGIEILLQKLGYPNEMVSEISEGGLGEDLSRILMK